jgi:hypothetical protein
VSTSSDQFAAEREKWRNFPRVRPAEIAVPGPGESAGRQSQPFALRGDPSSNNCRPGDWIS